eukprot:12391499-Ditylum_brightwellii.AAC.1
MELWKSGSSSGAGYRWCSRNKMSYRDPQATQLQRHFSKYAKCVHFELWLDNVAEHVFPEKAGQTQKHYMWRNLWLAGGMTIKEWVAQVSELNMHLKDFPTHNGNKIQPLNDNELLEILEYGAPVS